MVCDPRTERHLSGTTMHTLFLPADAELLDANAARAGSLGEFAH